MSIVDHPKRKNDFNSYRLSYGWTEHLTSMGKNASPRNRPYSYDVVFLEKSLLNGLEEWQVELILDHTQECLGKGKIHPYEGGILDNNVILNDENDIIDYQEIFKEVASSKKRPSASIELDLEFIFQLKLNDAKKTMSIKYAWKLWKKHRKSAYQKWSNGFDEFPKKESIALHKRHLTSLFGLVLEEEFIAKYNNNDNYFTIVGVVSQISIDFLEHKNITPMLYLKSAQTIAKTLSKSDTNNLLADYLFNHLDMVALNVLLDASEKKPMNEVAVLNRIRQYSAIEILCTYQKIFPKEKYKKEEIVRLLEKHLDKVNVKELFYRGTFSYQAIKTFSNGHEIKFSPHLYHRKWNKDEPYHIVEYNLLSDGKDIDTNYVIALLFNNLEDYQAFDVIQHQTSMYSLNPEDARKNPTLKQWERYVAGYDKHDYGILPSEIGIQLASRKRIS